MTHGAVRSGDITNLTEYRQNMREHHDHVRETGRPMFITSNGALEAVLLSPEVYDRYIDIIEKAELESMLIRADRESRAGQGRDVTEAFRELAAKYGLKLNL